MGKLANISTTKKVVGSLAIAGTAAAVAGLGTFGTFTDSSTPIASTIASGTLDIDVTQPEWALGYTWDIVLGRGSGATPPDVD